MKKREIAEIKKRFEATDCSITRLRGCYVNEDGEPAVWINKAFLSLPEEEMFKYLRVGKECLSGKTGDKLYNLAAAPDNQRFALSLEELRRTKLKDDEAFEDFCADVMGAGDWTGSYMILAMHNVYDVPGVAKDGTEMADASDTVYEYILTCICPVVRPIPYIGYNEAAHVFERIVPPLMMSGPKLGILYPAFNDRRADPRGALVYRANPGSCENIIRNLFNCEIGRTDAQKKEEFQKIMYKLLSGRSGFGQLKDIYECIIRRLIEWNQEDDMMLTVEDLKKVLTEAGADEETIEEFEDIWDEKFARTEKLTAKKIVDEKKLRVETDGAVINVKPSGLSKVTVETVAGTKYLTIEIAGRTEVNGVQTKENID